MSVRSSILSFFGRTDLITMEPKTFKHEIGVNWNHAGDLSFKAGRNSLSPQQMILLSIFQIESSVRYVKFVNKKWYDTVSLIHTQRQPQADETDERLVFLFSMSVAKVWFDWIERTDVHRRRNAETPKFCRKIWKKLTLTCIILRAKSHIAPHLSYFGVIRSVILYGVCELYSNKARRTISYGSNFVFNW